MTTENRTSEQGSVFSVTIIREFLLMALSHDAVTDAVDAMLFEHIVESRIHQSVITASLRPLITEVLDVATLEDWHYVCCKLIEDARETLGESPNSEPTRSTAQQQPDPGETREELGHLYAQEPLSPSKARRARQLIRKVSRLVGISVDEVHANAAEDAEAVRAADEYDAARASRSSAQTPASPKEPLEGSTPTTITLDTGQFNLLISGLGLARLALNGCGDEFVGFAKDYHRLADEIVAQLPGDGLAPRAARERLAIQEGRATSTRKPS